MADDGRLTRESGYDSKESEVAGVHSISSSHPNDRFGGHTACTKMAYLHQYDYIFAICLLFAALDAYNIGANDVAKWV